jgi:hypothetical protein
MELYIIKKPQGEVITLRLQDLAALSAITIVSFLALPPWFRELVIHILRELLWMLIPVAFKIRRRRIV